MLVNDFGAVNIDAALIAAVEENTISLNNGCVCCEVRDDLVDSLEELLLGDRSIDYVILEASGVADPEAVVMTFLQDRYAQLLRLDSITCVVDAEALFVGNDVPALAMLKLRQIGFADLVHTRQGATSGTESSSTAARSRATRSVASASTGRVADSLVIDGHADQIQRPRPPGGERSRMTKPHRASMRPVTPAW